ncbi:OPT family oligopeptide transporter [Wohlfahrtiimonas populi]|uniref:OPT family oligopeptide transporter n=1 Tax=Wohlfahrtiimonas populi TaxID=1940240 RepID=UPI00098D7413|nr:oligopeptide transporter, OPT family [Wohlfahrtiimonas populi]
MKDLKELTVRGIILGALITVVFTASNVYLGLKVGLTFSSAIPAAVISMAVLRFFKGSTILENNMVQTQASAAGTLSSVIFVIPGLLMIGYWQDFPFWLTFVVCSAGGMLGVLFSIPLRHAMVVKSNLPYPEGVAAAEILKAGCNTDTNEGAESSKEGLRDILFGGLVASIVTLFSNGFRVLAGSASLWFTQGKAIFQLPLGFSLALLSAGYLVGIISGIAIILGSIIAWFVVVPILSSTGDYGTFTSLADEAMTIWAKDVRFIGAGMLAIAALWTLITLLKPVIEGVKMSLGALKDEEGKGVDRTEQDLSPKTIFAIMFAMLLILVGTFYVFVQDSGLSAGIAWTLVVCAVIFAFVMGFLIAAASGYMAGLVGSSASPISGIGIVSIIVVSLILLVIGESNGFLGTENGQHFATALALFTTTAVLAIACISNDNLQDLKTGYLVHATPWKQQAALLIGCIIGALVIAPILDVLYQAYGFTGALPRADMDPTQVLAAPQATLMSTIATGIFSHNLQWTMILIGVGLGVFFIVVDFILGKSGSVLRLPALAVGMGIYLPPTITTPIFLGGLLAWFIRHSVKNRMYKGDVKDFEETYTLVDRKATLIASGLIVGESLVGVLMAVIIVISVSSGHSAAPLSLLDNLTNMLGGSTGTVTQLAGLFVFIMICTVFVRRSLSAMKK